MKENEFSSSRDAGIPPKLQGVAITTNCGLTRRASPRWCLGDYKGLSLGAQMHSIIIAQISGGGCRLEWMGS
ncbi:hypothetical protein M758_4G020600 [Ceratodon purpureus]|uniref:Uncharacterized protein n=1 Tax=Ceratodon purpureus TaxID=3225 RepID=A0A8T0I5N0_CERPU|nr:hypothetical protein KC19_4G022800 [Ceratodon purpureus]KAG0617854.1 hypothetical protein M758_4G020600 [Ceratodon purpureus]